MKRLGGMDVRYGELAVALGVLALAIVVFWQTQLIPVSPMYSKIGPKVMPTIAAAGLAAMGIALLVSALRGGWQSEEERRTKPDYRALLWVVAGLGLNALLINRIGFTLASILLFVCVARGFGSRRTLSNAIIAAIFALAAYFGFAKTLGINIGTGYVEQAIESAWRTVAG